MRQQRLGVRAARGFLHAPGLLPFAGLPLVSGPSSVAVPGAVDIVGGWSVPVVSVTGVGCRRSWCI